MYWLSFPFSVQGSGTSRGRRGARGPLDRGWPRRRPRSLATAPCAGNSRRGPSPRGPKLLSMDGGKGRRWVGRFGGGEWGCRQPGGGGRGSGAGGSARCGWPRRARYSATRAAARRRTRRRGGRSSRQSGVARRIVIVGVPAAARRCRLAVDPVGCSARLDSRAACHSLLWPQDYTATVLAEWRDPSSPDNTPRLAHRRRVHASHS